MGKPIIVFDLDGTLVDTAPDLLDSLNHTLDAGGIARTDAAGFRQFVGHGGRVMIERAYQAQKKALATDEHDRLFALFLEHYGANIPGQSKPYPGAVEALDDLAARGAILCVATNKRTDLSVALIGALGLERHFAVVCGPDRVSARKPDGAHVREAVQMAGGDPARAIMVGDGAPDVQAAKSAGAPCVVVSFGYTPIPAAELGGDVLIDRFDQLEAAIDGLIADQAVRRASKA